MSLTLGSNLFSLRAQGSLADATDLAAQTTQRLASGQRINSASDDAAGIAVAATLNVDARIATIAMRNVNDGISLISIEDSAFQGIENILNRMAELAEQSANGTYSTMQRSPIQAEFSALASEIERIAQTTEFNHISLLTTNNSISIQAGFKSYSTSQILVAGAQGTLQALALAPSGSSTLIYSVNGVNAVEASAAARTALAAVQTAMEAIDTKRGMLGATESRLNTALNNLATQRNEFKAAESRITDVDVAAEAARNISAHIKQQAAAAVLAQANQQPALVLTLLR